jgi:hypothetical protein
MTGVDVRSGGRGCRNRREPVQIPLNRDNQHSGRQNPIQNVRHFQRCYPWDQQSVMMDRIASTLPSIGVYDRQNTHHDHWVLSF